MNEDRAAPSACADSQGKPNLDELFRDEFAVLLLQGQNSEGERIFSYVRVTMPQIKRIYAALSSGRDFSPSEFGTVIASGSGEPSEELRMRMAAEHKMAEPIPPATFGPGEAARSPDGAGGPW